VPVQPTSSKPTQKQLRSSALARYAKARKNKSSPAPVPTDAVNEKEEREFTPFSEVEEEDEEPEDVADGDEAENDTFIVDEDDGDADADANAALDRMRYSSRTLDEHLAVFVEYIIALHSDPEYLSTATDDESMYRAYFVVWLLIPLLRGVLRHGGQCSKTPYRPPRGFNDALDVEGAVHRYAEPAPCARGWSFLRRHWRLPRMLDAGDVCV
jgi:hypothetical protein